MAREWRLHDVSALIDGGSLLIGDGYRAKNEELSSSGLPFARAGSINNGFQFDDADREPGAREQNRRGQPVGSAAHHDGVEIGIAADG